MATYTGSYTNDLGRVFRSVALKVYLVDAALNNTAIATTSLSFDDRFLPDVFKRNLTGGKPLCAVEQGTRSIRTAIAHLSETQRLYIPCPFRGGTSEFMQFFTQLNSNAEIALAELSPETIAPFYLDVWSRQ